MRCVKREWQLVVDGVWWGISWERDRDKRLVQVFRDGEIIGFAKFEPHDVMTCVLHVPQDEWPDSVRRQWTEVVRETRKAVR